MGFFVLTRFLWWFPKKVSNNVTGLCRFLFRGFQLLTGLWRAPRHNHELGI